MMVEMREGGDARGGRHPREEWRKEECARGRTRACDKTRK